MSERLVRIRELIGWDLDNYEYRPLLSETALRRARDFVQRRSQNSLVDPTVSPISDEAKKYLATHAKRSDLTAEMTGLSWSLDSVDLRSLIAFQRRLYFSDNHPQYAVPTNGSWPELVAYCFGPTKAPTYVHNFDQSSGILTLASDNPNVHIRVAGDAITPLSIHAGSPFFEVARFRDRWFLRDGYHRAYSLMRAGIWRVPALVVRASTITELGATQPWFFAEDILFSAAPPLITDFLDDDLVVEYDRPRLIKTIRITMNETLAPEREKENKL
jgi:hypothetical protein